MSKNFAVRAVKLIGTLILAIVIAQQLIKVVAHLPLHEFQKFPQCSVSGYSGQRGTDGNCYAGGQR